jgi:4-diphosphocytidyl-2-C-methyl-D-erythritol kinase
MRSQDIGKVPNAHRKEAERKRKNQPDFTLFKRWLVAESHTVPSLELFSPAKLNLFLAITGRRPDGFHDLVSVVAPVRFGDRLVVETTSGDGFSLSCDVADVPADGSNLILRAAQLFKDAAGLKGGAKFVLEKRIPMGAGLGGGSSNAVAALQAMNRLSANPLPAPRLLELATQLGSDCALFMHEAPLIMRGRGEKVERLQEGAGKRLSGRKVLIFKPSFGIATAWAYRRMAEEAPQSYLPSFEAEQRLAAWIHEDAPAEKLLFNNMEQVAFEKYVALPVLLRKLQSEFGLAVGMSGSGSACFALLNDAVSLPTVRACIQQAWGAHTFIVDTEIV